MGVHGELLNRLRVHDELVILPVINHFPGLGYFFKKILRPYEANSLSLDASIKG